MKQTKTKVLVFGGSGFLGSHVADELSRRDYDVTVFDIKDSPYLKENQKMIVGDVFDRDAVEAAIEGQDIVYNLAAIADIDEANKKPAETIRFNILGNLNVLEASLKHKVERFVFASTVYANSHLGAFYKTSKRACEDLIKDYHKVYDLPYTILRYGSVYGSRGATNSSVYKLLQQALQNKKIEYSGTGDEIREYVHVYDVSRLSVDILDPKYQNQTFTLTGAQRITYKELLNTINEILGGEIDIVYKNKESETHYKTTPFSFSPDISEKILANPQIDLGQGLLDCIQEIHESLSKNNK